MRELSMNEVGVVSGGGLVGILVRIAVHLIPWGKGGEVDGNAASAGEMPDYNGW